MRDDDTRQDKVGSYVKEVVVVGRVRYILGEHMKKLSRAKRS